MMCMHIWVIFTKLLGYILRLLISLKYLTTALPSNFNRCSVATTYTKKIANIKSKIFDVFLLNYSLNMKKIDQSIKVKILFQNISLERVQVYILNFTEVL